MTSPKTPSKIFELIPLRVWGTMLLAVVAVAGFSVYNLRPRPGQRDLTTPATRLVGHWLLYSPSELPSAHLFYSPVEPADDNRGRVTMIDVDGGLTFEGIYRVETQYKHGLDLNIREDLGPNLQRKVIVTVARDGLSGRYRYFLLDSEQDQRMEYQDAQEAPPAGFAEKLRNERRSKN